MSKHSVYKTQTVYYYVMLFILYTVEGFSLCSSQGRLRSSLGVDGIYYNILIQYYIYIIPPGSLFPPPIFFLGKNLGNFGLSGLSGSPLLLSSGSCSRFLALLASFRSLFCPPRSLALIFNPSRSPKFFQRSLVNFL